MTHKFICSVCMHYAWYKTSLENKSLNETLNISGNIIYEVSIAPLSIFSEHVLKNIFCFNLPKTKQFRDIYKDEEELQLTFIAEILYVHELQYNRVITYYLLWRNSNKGRNWFIHNEIQALHFLSNFLLLEWL